jgi:hypothetical protein
MSHRWISIILFATALTVSVWAETILPDFQANSTLANHPPQRHAFSIADTNTQTIYTAFGSQRDGLNWDIALARFNYNLQIQGEVTYLNDPPGSCQHPRLVLGTSGGFGACWVQAGHVYFRSLNQSGLPVSLPVIIDDNTAVLAADAANIAALTDGYLLVWCDTRDSSKIWSQKVGFGGNLIGSNFPIQPDSTGNIIGLETQNHPDGRVLVSWVADGNYSRGRWLDNTGAFSSNVFDMADTFSSISKSLVRFAEDGTGILYQYAGDSIFTANLDSMGEQVDSHYYHGYWHQSGGGSEPVYYSWYWTYSFPDLEYSGGASFLNISRYEYHWMDMWGGSINTIYNFLCSTTLDTFKHIWGTTTDYDICFLNSQQLLVSYMPAQPSSVILQKYSIATLDSLSARVGIYEPGFDLAQKTSNICVHQNGGFRFSYTTQTDSGLGIFTRYFSADGTPSAPDTQISMNLGQLIYPGTARMRLTADDKTLIAWSFGGDIWGTLFSGAVWSGGIQHYIMAPDLDSTSKVPNFDINVNNKTAVAWRVCTPGVITGRMYYQYFPQLFGSPFTALALIPPTGTGQPGQPDVGLRDDGHFLVCWNKWQSYVGPIQIQAGYNYSTLQGDIVQISEDSNGGACSHPVLRKSPSGYWITWIQYASPNNRRVYLRQVNNLGSPVGNVIPITGAGLMSMGIPSLAVSASSGNFVIAWRDSSSGDPGDILARQFNADGSFYGDYAYRVNSDSGNALQKEPAVAFGPNDQLYISWTDYRIAYHQGDIFCKVIEWEDALAATPGQIQVPLQFGLKSPHPNPFNSSTVISYQLPAFSPVRLTVWDTAGRLVATLLDGWQEAGSHEITFTGSKYSSGLYFARMQSGEFTAVQKMMLLK